MTKEDSEGILIPAPIATEMYQLDGGMTMPWVRWFQQFKATTASVVIGEVKLPGAQTVGTAKLSTPCVVRLPKRYKVDVYKCEAKCFTAPTGAAFTAIITYRRAGATAFASIFRAGEYLTIAVGATNATPIVPLVNEFYPGDDFNCDVIGAGGACAGVELTMRGGLLFK